MEKAIKKTFPLFVLPTLVAFAIGFIVPFGLGIWLSLCEFVTVADAKFVGLRNYMAAFSDGIFVHSFVFTALFAVASLAISNVVAFFLASLLSKKLPGTNTFRTTFFMPNLIGGIVLGYIWQLIFDGILVRYEVALKLYAHLGFWGLVIMVCWQQIGYRMIIYIAGLKAIPREVNEAAAIDGASRKQLLTNITLPMMMPVITINTFLSLTGGFKLFDQNLALTAGEPMRQTEMMALNIFNTFYARTGYEGVGQAKAVVFFVIVVGLGLLQLRITRTREVQQ